jgi:3-oxoacyl-[acyl-carrier protein] reductase
MSDKELVGLTAVVTGAGRNIGRAIALSLAAGGAAVLVNARSNKTEADKVAAEIEIGGGKAAVHLGDVADPETAEGLAAAALKAFGRIDILVNNAALRREKNIADVSYEEWREIMGVILDGAFLCTKVCIPALKKNGGSIINIGGMSAHIGSAHWRTIWPPTTLPPIAWCLAPFRRCGPRNR